MAGKPDDDNRRYTTSPTKNYDYTAELTYNEPIAKATFLQFRYKFQYKYSESDRFGTGILVTNFLWDMRITGIRI